MRVLKQSVHFLDLKNCLQALLEQLMQIGTHFYGENEGKEYDYFVELMATNPFKTHIDIDRAIKKLIDNKADSVIGVSHLEDHHPLRIKKIVKIKLLISIVC